MKMNRIVCLLLSAILILCTLSMHISAKEPSTEDADLLLDELVFASKEAILFAEMARYQFVDLVSEEHPYEPKEGIDLQKWARDKGYLPSDDEKIQSDVLERYCTGDLTGEQLSSLYAYSSQMNTREIWKKELEKYFYHDVCGLISCNHSGGKEKCINGWFLEHEGRVYGFSFEGGNSVYPVWESARISSHNGELATLTYNWWDAYNRQYIDVTVNLIKVEGVWRVYDGSYFQEVHSFHYVPYEGSLPETGDGTAAYALVFTLAALPLAGLGVAEWKKRRRAV